MTAHRRTGERLDFIAVPDHYDLVGCSTSHTSEVYAVDVAAGGDEFPGSEELNRQADKQCVEKIDDYVWEPLSLPRNWS